jgi:hypothetical protein
MIERLFDLVKGQTRSEAPIGTEVLPRDGPEIVLGPTQQNAPTRRLHGHMKRDTSSLVVATLRTGLLVGIAVILILILFPAAMAQAAGLR